MILDIIPQRFIDIVGDNLCFRASRLLYDSASPNFAELFNFNLFLRR